VERADGISGLVAQAGERLVGFVCWRMSAEEDEGLLAPQLCGSVVSRTVAYVLTLGVDQAWRRAGVASELLRRMKCLHCHGTSLLWLHVLDSNDTALRFYQRCGFAVARRESDFYLIGGRREDAYALCHFMNGGRPPLSCEWLLLAARRRFRALFWAKGAD